MRFFRPGLLAIEPKAFFFDFPEPAKPSTEEHDGVAVVTIRGPIMHHDEGFFESYDAIKSRVREAAAKKPKAILLSIDSPGGLVSGCFDTAREIRAICDNADVPLYGYVDGCSCSGGYALLCVADHIFIPGAGMAGSIGVLNTIIDATKSDARDGLAFTFIKSGARKSDGNPHSVPSDESIAAEQANVNAAAREFFELVSEYREQLDADAVRALEAGVFIGQAAIAAGLADEIATEDEAIAQIAQWATTAAEPSATEEDNMKTLAEIKAALKAVAEGDGDEKDKEEARKALAALEPKEPDGDEAPPVAAEGGDAPGDGEDDEEDEEDEPTPAAASSQQSGTVASSDPLDLAARMHKLELENRANAEAKAKRRAAKAERVEKTRLLATRPDFTAETKAWLERQPLATVQTAVKEFAKGSPIVVPNPAAVAQSAAKPTLGQGQGGSSDNRGVQNLIKRPETDEEIMDRRMGLGRKDPRSAIKQNGNWTEFGALTNKDATELIRIREEERKSSLGLGQ